MNASTVTTSTTTHTTVNKTYKIEMIEDGAMTGASEDEDDEPPSSPGSAYEEGHELMHMGDEVTSQLAAAGPVGVAAAAAIASAKKRKRPHSFETNPSIRKRQQNRLLRKLRQIIYEFTGRVGQQAIVLVATPGKPNTSYKVFGAKPLEDVVRNLKSIVMEELETALAQQAPPPPQEDPSLFELPPLIIDGIPTPVEKMTQAQLRAFIPLMLKYSTGRGKPGWGRESTRPPWWPKELPWANVRMDARTEEEKQKISWTHALRKIVINCYRYHGREDLLPTFSDDEDKINQLTNNSGHMHSNNNNVGVLKIHSSGSIVNTNNSGLSHNNNGTTKIEIQTTPNAAQTIANAQVCLDPMTLSDVDYTQTVLSTIQNADGTVSLIQVDPNNPIITLPDGTTAQVQGVATLHTTTHGETGATIQTVQGLTDANGHTENMTVDLTEATLAQDGQLIITGEDGQGYPVSVSNMITVPVSASMYQTMVANIQQLHPNGDGTLCLTPMQVDSNNHNNLQCYPAQGNSSGKIIRAIFQNHPLRCQLNYNNNNNNNINNNNNNNNNITNNINNNTSSQSIGQSKIFLNNNINNNNSNIQNNNLRLTSPNKNNKKRRLGGTDNKNQSDISTNNNINNINNEQQNINSDNIAMQSPFSITSKRIKNEEESLSKT